MEQKRGQGVRMADVAKAASISRQALYLHFASRSELLVATTHYVDRERRLHERNRRWRESINGLELLESYIEFWGKYLPEIYSLARALLAVRDKDEAAAAAWDNRMTSLREGCRRTVEALYRDKLLTPELTPNEATELFWTMLSVRNWEQLTVECGWSQEAYIERMKKILRRLLVQDTQKA